MEILDRKTITIEKFEKIVKSHKYEMTEIMILYNMSCNENYNKLTTAEKYNLMTYIYLLHKKDETKTDLGFFSDAVMNNYKDILNKKIDNFNIYNYL